MEIQGRLNIIPEFINTNINYLMNNVENVSYTGFFIENSNGINEYYFKINNDFYIIKARSYKEIEEQLVNKINIIEESREDRFKIKSNNIPHSTMNLYELMSLYKNNNKVRVDDYFITDSNDTIKGSKVDYLNLVKNIILLEKELRDNNIDKSNKYEVMKYIYNKYKMIASYWDHVGNYGGIHRANVELLYDRNRVINHPYSMLGLINDNYATCEGMARGLVELYRYFGINSEFIHSELHGICKIYLRDNEGRKKVTYIDLSKEVTRNFQDNKYEYVDRKPILRRISNRIATPNSYNYFMKANAGLSVDDPDVSLATDYKPQIRIISIEESHIRR